MKRAAQWYRTSSVKRQAREVEANGRRVRKERETIIIASCRCPVDEARSIREVVVLSGCSGLNWFKMVDSSSYSIHVRPPLELYILGINPDPSSL